MSKKAGKNRKIPFLLRISSELFFFAGILFSGSALFLKAYNNQLIVRQQEITQQIRQYEEDNEKARQEVSMLSEKERVIAITGESGGLQYNPGQIRRIDGQK